MKNFEQIYKENYQIMFRVAQKMIYNRDVVSDIVQEVFIYLFNKLEENYKIQFVRSWLYRATLNKCIDYQKSRTKFSDIDIISEDIAERNELEQEEMKNILKIALNKLKEEEKKLLVLYSEGLSYKEIAEVLDIKFVSVGKTLSRTLRKMENELKKMRYEVF